MAKKRKSNGAAAVTAATQAGDYVRKQALATTETALSATAATTSDALAHMTDLNIHSARFAAHRYLETCRTLAALALCRSPHDAMTVMSDAAHMAADDYAAYTTAMQGAVEAAIQDARS